METCVCAEPITECGQYPCGHALCSECTLRMRALMNDKSCPWCRDEAENVAIVSSLRDSPQTATIPLHKYGIMCQNEDIRLRLLHNLKQPCPKCDTEQGSTKTLRDHVQKAHHKNICNVCARHGYEFSKDYELFNNKELASHMNKDHVLCQFCNWHFYSGDELAKHCRQQHESCFICERLDPTRPQYFPDYGRLEKHFMEDHYMCMVPACLEDKFVVFSSKVELKSHMIERHRDMVGSVRQFQRVELGDLSLEDSSSSSQNQNKNKRKKNQKPEEDPRNLAKKRYQARLQIDANHDRAKVDQIEQANYTFKTKKVPVEVFISTYSNVLNADEDEITALLLDFAKFTDLPSEKTTDLERVLAQRAARTASRRTQTPRSSSGTSSASTRLAKPSALSRVSAATWLNPERSGSGGIIDFTNLPKLGDGHAVPRSRQAPNFLSSPAIPYHGGTLQRATTVSRAPTWNQRQDYGPQTRLPGLTSRQDRLAARCRTPTQTRSVPVTPTLNRSPASSSTSLVGTRAASPQHILSSANLPSLPSRNGHAEKKASKKVLRIV